ncbi:metalloregulator ArsR/SmtB family transcription factor [Arthrobacter sp. UYEF20]|uniref:ArsR/SmtB family transcription factor n=1 Tax=Arthrobacter sp. UYEF20 TaxID=1756363 RepID=UPI00339698E6
MEINESEVALSRLFRALADPTRRGIVDLLATHPLSVLQIATQFPVSIQAIAKHLVLLESAGLLTSSKVGRVRTYTLTPAVLDLAACWLFAQHTEEACSVRAREAPYAQ